MENKYNIEETLNMKVKDLDLPADVLNTLIDFFGDDVTLCDFFFNCGRSPWLQKFHYEERNRVADCINSQLSSLNPNLYIGGHGVRVDPYSRYSGKHEFEILPDEKLYPGDYVGYPMEWIRTCHLYDAGADYDIETPMLYDVGCDPKLLNNNYILILQYLGDYQFLELISGKILIGDSNKSDMFYDEDPIDMFRNTEECERCLATFMQHPLKIEIDEAHGNDFVSFKVDDELKSVYASTTLKNQEYIKNTLDEMEKLSRKHLRQDIEANKKNFVDTSDVVDVSDANDFIESHSRKL